MIQCLIAGYQSIAGTWGRRRGLLKSSREKNWRAIEVRVE